MEKDSKLKLKGETEKGCQVALFKLYRLADAEKPADIKKGGYQVISFDR